LKTKTTGLKSSKTKPTKTVSKLQTTKGVKKAIPTAVKTKSGATLSAVKGTKQSTLVKVKSKAVVATKVAMATKVTVAQAKVTVGQTKVSVAQKLTAARLVKTAEVVELKAKKTSLTLVAKAGTKMPATKISRSEPSSPGSKIITGKFSIDTAAPTPTLAAKMGADTVSHGAIGSSINFKVGDKIVYPGHGVGEIEGIRTTTLGGQEHHIYNIKILDSGMKVMVPVSQASAVGLRKIIDKKAIDEVFSILKDRDFKIDTQTWNRRFREYSQKIKTGSVFEIAVVLRDLSVLSADKELSFGEKKMLDMAETLLVSEIAIAKSRPHDKVVGELRALFA
jgi:CarD family transcriptional regulator